MYVSVYNMYVYTYTCVYIYIYADTKERQRERMHANPFVGWLLSSCCLADFFSVLRTPSLDLKPGEASQDFLLNPLISTQIP